MKNVVRYDINSLEDCSCWPSKDLNTVRESITNPAIFRSKDVASNQTQLKALHFSWKIQKRFLVRAYVFDSETFKKVEEQVSSTIV